jgi:phosphohistidine phosphatase SixA
MKYLVRRKRLDVAAVRPILVRPPGTGPTMPRALLALLVALLVGPPTASASPEAAWTALREGGAVALIRHARAPGTGDPAGFRLGDCATQRNLSDEGRRQAVDLGRLFADRGVPVGRVLTSGWCRAGETARLAFGTADRWPPLDSVFSDRAEAGPRTAALREAVGAWAGPGTLVLVTHQVNITALTGIVPREGEVVVLAVRDGGFTVVGRVP